MKITQKWVVTDPETLRILCIRNGWFTCGTTRQYNKMFDLNQMENGHTLHTVGDVALAIWLCSDNISYSEIYNKITDAQDDYLMRLADEYQAMRECAADEAYCGYFD